MQQDKWTSMVSELQVQRTQLIRFCDQTKSSMAETLNLHFLQVLLDGNCRARLQLDYLQTDDTADTR